MRSMKKWEQEVQMKIHKDRIKRARHPLRSSTKTLHTSSGSQRISTTGILLSYLREFGLQQHYRNLAEQGFDEDPHRFAMLSHIELENILASLKILPGQKEKFKAMQERIRGNSIDSLLAEARACSAVVDNNFKEVKIQTRTGSMDNAYRYNEHSRLSETVKLKNELIEAQEEIKMLERQIAENQVKNNKNSVVHLPPISDSPKISTKNDKKLQTQVKFVECEEKRDFDVNELGKSYDSWKMWSTLHNMDIEEISKCFSRVVASQCNKNSNQSLGLIQEITVPLYDYNETIPEEKTIYNYCRNLMNKALMEKECPVLALIYIGRLMEKARIGLNNWNWKRIVFTSLLLGSKIWDDESVTNATIADNFSMYTLSEMNKMERSFLILLDYELNVQKADYANAYFLLRSYTKKKDRSYPLKPLDVDTVLKLQKKCEKTENVAKEALLKSF